MILTHGANSLSRGRDFVEIGGRKYPVVKIGNQLWITKDLDYKFDVNGSTIPVGSAGLPTTPSAWYYDNNEASYGIDGTYKCGMLYNWYAASYLDNNKSTLLPSGWRVPSLSDYNSLASVISAVTGGEKLKALDDSVTSGFPSSWNGTDIYKFKALPQGWRRSDSGYIFTQFGVHAHYWISDSASSSNAWSFYLNPSSAEVSSSQYNAKTNGFALRLVRDAT